MVKKTMNQMTLLAALRRSESPFPVSNAEQKIRNSIWRMITFFLGEAASIFRFCSLLFREALFCLAFLMF